MSLPNSCKTKSCYDADYGCTRLNDCQIYQDLKAEYEYEMMMGDNYTDDDEELENELSKM